jgi:hypothetical protein
MTQRVTRREILSLSAISYAVGAAGCISSVAGNNKQQAVDASEEASETFRKARESRRDGHDQWQIEDYAEAESHYRQASTLFKRAERKFNESNGELREAGCDDMADNDKNRASVASAWAEACSGWANAADAVINGKHDLASDYLSEAEDWERTAKNLREEGIKKASC